MSAGAPIDFYLQGSRGAYAAAAAATEGWQSIAVACLGCGARYLASVARRCESDDAEAVAGYPDVAGQTLLARRYLHDECPDHGFRVRVRAFTVVV
ncbi:MAG: hypothetical protein ACRDJE_14445 [Dehalococcoidia bacterium]